MKVLREYYPFQLLLKSAGLAPYQYGLFFENRFRYSWTALIYSTCQTVLNCGYILWIVSGIIFIVKQTSLSSNTIGPSIAPHQSTDVSDILMLFVNPVLNNGTAIICRICAILVAPKIPRIFENIDSVDRLLRASPGKDSGNSRRGVLGLIFVVIFMSIVIHLPLCYASFIADVPMILCYMYMNTFSSFTGMCGEWTQISLFALLKERFATINEKLREICKESMEFGGAPVNERLSNWIETSHCSPGAMEGRRQRRVNGSTGSSAFKARCSGRRRFCLGRSLFERKRKDSKTKTFGQRIVPVLSADDAERTLGARFPTDFGTLAKRPWRIPDGVTALELEALRFAHRELSSTMSSVNDLFQFQNLCLFCAAFLHGLDNLYYTIQESLRRFGMPSASEEIPLFRHPIFAGLLAFHFYFRIMSFGRIVLMTNIEAKRASEYLERLTLHMIPPADHEEARQELEYFKRHMASRPNKFSACGVIDFESSLILQVINTVINYIFLMLQQPVKYT